MRLLISLLLAGTAAASNVPYFAAMSPDPGAWPEILSAIGLESRPPAAAHVFVARAGSPASIEWNARVDKGAILILEGESSLAEMFGFRRTKENVRAGSVTDVHQPKLEIVWERAAELPVFELPDGARVFTRERWSGIPVVAGFKRGTGAVLWLAASPGDHGYEHFPYLLAALCDLGLEVPFRSARLWAFFDSAYRSRVDLDYFAARWRKAGIAALHVAAWHYFEPNIENDAWLTTLIEVCHREGILVYAWLELPHVSERFWESHPEWREKTAVLQDAHLDWRKLMNLANRDCFHAVSDGVRGLLSRFDWDGVNLAELYFESLEGIANPSRFTPMNPDVRSAFRTAQGFDPVELFTTRSDELSRQRFLEFRAELARQMQEEWLQVVEAARVDKPYLDLVLTHVDDRLDPGIRQAVGADAARVLPLLDRHRFTFLVEDPATVWHLGPQRYQTLAARYRELTSHPDHLAVDINLVERYQNVYPTKQQTGAELLQLVHEAARQFQRVALYFESSLVPVDLGLLPSAAAAVTRFERLGHEVVVNSMAGVGLAWKGSASVDGQLWPVADEDTVWLPAGQHQVKPAAGNLGIRLVRLNGDLKSAKVVTSRTIEFSYRSDARVIAVFDRPAGKVRVDRVSPPLCDAGPRTVLLPSGDHVVTVSVE